MANTYPVTTNPEVIPPQFLPLILEVWEHYYIVQYVTVAAGTFYVYDWVLSFKDEVQLFWGSRLSTVKTLFFLNRYFPLVSVVILFSLQLNPNPNRTTCILQTVWGDITGIITHAVVELILLLRVRALYNKSKAVMWSLGILFVLEMISMSTLLVYEMSSQIKFQLNNAPIVPFTRICGAEIVSFYYAFWIPAFFMDFSLLIAVSYRGIRTYRQLGSRSFSAPLLHLLIRDSFLYFLGVFLVYLCNLILWKSAPYDLFALAIVWSLAVPCAAASRLLITVRRAGSVTEMISEGSTVITI